MGDELVLVSVFGVEPEDLCGCVCSTASLSLNLLGAWLQVAKQMGCIKCCCWLLVMCGVVAEG